MTSLVSSGAIPARFNASRITIAPSWGAVKLDKEPRNAPIGVRTADTITLAIFLPQKVKHKAN
jgi:hypothetical protein